MSVTALSSDNTVEIVSVLSDAFQDYPVMRHVLGPDVPGSGAPYSVRLHRLVQLFVSGRAYRDEPLLGVRDERGILVAAAIVTLPNSKDPPPTFIALRESIWAELGTDARARYDVFAKAANFFTALPQHHHLNMIGVKRSQQGLGLARQLLDAVAALAARDESSAGVSLTTEHSQNVKFYEKFGYAVLGHARIATGFESWGLFRPRPA